MAVRLVGANPGVTLFAAAGSDERTALASVWRVDWSSKGAGRALVLWHAGRTRVVTERPDLGRWLADQFVRHFPEVAGLAWPAPEITVAGVDLALDLATGMRATAADITVEIADPIDHRVIRIDEFTLGKTVNALSNVYVPCRSASITVGGVRLPGRPDVRTEPSAASSAFLADAEVWSG